MSAQNAGAAQTAGSDYVGGMVCRKCHPDVWLNFYKNPHYKSIAIGKEPPERTGCEGCHGPGKAHVEAGGGKQNIRAFSEMQPQAILDACLACHSTDIGKANVRRSLHTQSNIVCSNCHSIHKSPTPTFLLAKTQRDLCYSCHGQVRAQFSMPFKHRVNEGFMECTGCHNPHGAYTPAWRMGVRPAMVEQAMPNEEVCMKCHSEKRGPFLYEHAAVRVDGCETCHHPHGSTNPRLLRRPVVFTLCLECHNGAGNFGRHGDGIVRQSPSHNMADPRFQNCTACHVRIHGSNSDARFLR
jgi:DmsE family decaheme c-type cytochrome